MGRRLRGRDGPSDGRGGDALGIRLAGAGASVLVGAPGADEGAGAAALFTRNPDDGEWREATRLSFPEEGPAGYGSAVAFDGRSAWVGASGVGQGTGGAQAFRVVGATMTFDSETTIAAPGFNSGALFGSFVALRDEVAVVAAANADMRLGAAVVYERDGGAWVEGTTLRESTRTLDAVLVDTVPDDAGLPAFGGAWSNYPFFESGVVAVSSWGEGLFGRFPGSARWLKPSQARTPAPALRPEHSIPWTGPESWTAKAGAGAEGPPMHGTESRSARPSPFVVVREPP